MKKKVPGQADRHSPMRTPPRQLTSTRGLSGGFSSFPSFSFFPFLFSFFSGRVSSPSISSLQERAPQEPAGAALSGARAQGRQRPRGPRLVPTAALLSQLAQALMER